MFKTKRDAKGQVEKYEARLEANYSRREGIDFNEAFSLVSTKDSLRIIMTTEGHFDLELHQMDVRTTFLNGDLVEDAYMSQFLGFEEIGKEHKVCKLHKSIFGLKQASRQWYLKFDEVVTTNDFKENIVNQCIYLKHIIGFICL